MHSQATGRIAAIDREYSSTETIQGTSPRTAAPVVASKI